MIGMLSPGLLPLSSRLLAVLLTLVSNPNNTQEQQPQGQPFSRQEAASIVDNHLLPKDDYSKRIGLGKEILLLDENKSNNQQPIRPDDPLTAFTYGEFPLTSLDMLIDKALEKTTMIPTSSSSSNNMPFRFLDLGSGCARLCFYVALSRGPHWQVHGIEAMDSLYNEALRAEQVGYQNGWFVHHHQDDPAATATNSASTGAGTSLHLHHGMADTFTSVLAQCNLIFMYSTALQSGPFLPQIGGMILSREWNELLSQHCQPGCIVVTTDRALDPEFGWELLDRIDVPNPELWESTAFIQRRKGS